MKIEDQLAQKLDKIRWRQDLARRGERKESVSPELAEALRTEIRTALDAGGGNFDVNVARRVYDLAIAARDMCVAATSDVKQVIDQIKDTNGPMETLQDPDAPEPALQASETFGARLIRELLAVVPSMMRSGGDSGDDPRKLVHALAEARQRGMDDVAEELEVKLFGRALPGPRPIGTVVAVNVGSFEHGFSDGKQNLPPGSKEPDYKAGYLRGTEERYLESAPSRPEDAEACPACGKGSGDSCDGPMSHPSRCAAHVARRRVDMAKGMPI